MSLPLHIHSPSAQIATELRLPSSLPLSALRQKIYTLSGIPADAQLLSLHSARTDDPAARAVRLADLPRADDVAPGAEEPTLASIGAHEGACVQVLDARPAGSSERFVADESVEKWEMDDDTYAQRRDTVRAYKQANKMGRFDPAVQAAAASPPPAAPIPEDIVPGKRCVVLREAGDAVEHEGSRGTVRFAGTTSFAKGNWVGVEYDEPCGKGNGSVAGVEYFKARNQHASFVRPERVRVGDYPELDLEDELGLDDDEEM